MVVDRYRCSRENKIAIQDSRRNFEALPFLVQVDAVDHIYRLLPKIDRSGQVAVGEFFVWLAQQHLNENRGADFSYFLH